MKIEFDGSQNQLKKIVALYEGGQRIEVICPECSEPISISTQEQEKFPALECSSCKKMWKVEAGEKSKRERVWDKFEEWEKGNSSK